MWTCDINGNWISEDFSSFVLSSGLDNCNFLHAVTRCPLRNLSPLQDFAISLGSTSGLQAVLLQAGWFLSPFVTLLSSSWLCNNFETDCVSLFSATSSGIGLTAVWLNWCNLISSTRTLLNFVYSAPSSTCQSFLSGPNDNLGPELQPSK